MSWPWLVITGVVAGVFAGLFGIGGGIVIVPALVMFAGYPLVKATGTSLAAILLPVGIFGVIAYYRAKIIDLRASFYIALGLLTSVAFGAWVANTLSPEIMKIIYAGFCLYVSWTLIDPVKIIKQQRLKNTTGSSLQTSEPETVPHPPAAALFGIGLLAGVMAGMFGIGGGNIIVPFLILIFHYPAKRAIASSLGALLLPMGLPGVLYYYHAGNLDIQSAAWIAAGILAGTILGAKTTIALPQNTVKFLYGLFLIFVAARLLFF